LPDFSGNGFDELAALGENADVRHLKILDSGSCAQVNRTDFPEIRISQVIDQAGKLLIRPRETTACPLTFS